MKRPTRVLIVDDRETARETLRSILLGFDCSFSQAGSGATALELMSLNDFDVIFLDLQLPDLSGIEILRRARELGRALGRVIVLTGLPEPGTQEEAMKLGAFKYFTKNPVDRGEIRKAFAEATNVITTKREAVSPLVRGIPRTSVRDTAKGSAGSEIHPRLLVLDDQNSWLDTIEQVLGKDFDLVLTTSVEEACKHVRKERFDLVVLDMRLVGGISGLDVLSRMRKNVRDLRAIILTGHPEFRTAVEGGRRGALDYLSKVEVATLPETVRKILIENAKPKRVFLSYNKADRPQVYRLFSKLMGRGFLPWMDKKCIVPGKKWEPEIKRAIEESDFFVYCVSPYSAEREGVIRWELNHALELQKRKRQDSIYIIAARLEDCQVTEALSDLQYVDLFKRDGFAKLLQALSYDRSNGK